MLHEDGAAADHFQHLHDLRMVWASEIQGPRLVGGDSGELADRVPGILFSGAGQSHREQSGVYRGAIEDHPGGDHAGGVLFFLGSLSERAAEVELYGGIWTGGGGGVFRFLPMVNVLEKSQPRRGRKTIAPGASPGNSRGANNSPVGA